ncbi:MAG TPA: TonB-dependent receptor, partial [Magnetospirillum sp.]|nr:TonB-dependent receptor [Magnetospirillum sp.]
PGVAVQTGGGVSGLPVIHGLADDRVRQVVNGMTITSACPNHMNPPLSYLDAESVGRIEVLPGVTPVSAGGDSIGGTIVVDQAPPVFAEGEQDYRATGRLSTAYRSTSHGIATTGSLTGATKSVSLNYTGSFSRAGDYHRGGDNERVQTSQYRKQEHSVTMAGRHDGDVLAMQVGYGHTPSEGFPNARMDLVDNTNKFVNGRYDARFGWGELALRAYWQGVDHKMDFLDGVKSAGTMPMLTEAQDMGYSAKADIPLNNRDTLRIGNEFHRYTLNDWWPPTSNTPNGMMSPNDFQNINDGERNRLGTFAEWEAKWTPRWSTLLGVRNDTVWMDTGDVQGYSQADNTGGMMPMSTNYLTDSTNFNARSHAKTDVNFDATALARFEADKSASYEGGYARKTRSPNLYERYSWSTNRMASSMNTWFGDGNGYVGDIDLKPEVAHTVSLGADWHDPARKVWGVKVTPYYTYVQDYIDADLVGNFTNMMGMPTGFGLYKFANHDAQLYGADISGNRELLDDVSLGRAVFKASLSWVRGQNLDTGDNLYNIMPVTLRMGVDHRLGGWFSGADMELVDSKDFVASDRKENRTPAYALFNLRTGYEWDNLVLSAGIENLFNHLYHEPLGGTDLAERTKTNGSNVYGAGRTYLAGVTVKF